MPLPFFILRSKTPKERLDLGYEEMNYLPFVVRAFDNIDEAYALAVDADVAIFGDCPNSFLEKRMSANKISFKYTERIFKKGRWRYYHPRINKLIKNKFLKYKNSNLYVLCASSFTCGDLAFCGFPAEKCFNWGYFPEISNKDLNELLLKKGDKTLEIIYVGRLLKLKKVFLLIKALNVMNKEKKNVHVSIVGDGPIKNTLIKYVKTRHIENIDFLGSINYKDVFKHLEKSDVLYLGSNFYEGWGAVVNEAMSNACIPVVSHSVGSAPCLIKNGINGYVFKLNDLNGLCNAFNNIYSNFFERKVLMENAYNTIDLLWNASVAVDRFLECIYFFLKSENELDNKFVTLFNDGPMANAKAINNNWIKYEKK